MEDFSEYEIQIIDLLNLCTKEHGKNRLLVEELLSNTSSECFDKIRDIAQNNINAISAIKDTITCDDELDEYFIDKGIDTLGFNSNWGGTLMMTMMFITNYQKTNNLKYY